MKMFRVGGIIRDEILGIKSKDVDFACEAESFEAMHDELVKMGFTIHHLQPEMFTIRGRFPKVGKERAEDADFVLCRKDGFSSDHRRPDFVEAGTIMDDLARRDFTMNAIAKDENGEFLDPFDGRGDIERRLIRFVGDPMTRIREDALRAIRGLRFEITKSMILSGSAFAAICSDETVELLGTLPSERITDELTKMFTFDTLATLRQLSDLPEKVRRAILRDITLVPSMAEFPNTFRVRQKSSF